MVEGDDAAHDQALKVQVGEAEALVDVERDHRRRGAGVDEHARALEGLGVGVLVLESARVRDDGAEQAVGDVRRDARAQKESELGHDDAGGRRVRAHEEDVAEGCVGGVVVHHGHVARALEHRPGVVEPGRHREVDHDEKIGVALVLARAHVRVRARQEAVESRHHVVVGQEVGDPLALPVLPNQLAQGQARPQGVAVRVGVGAYDDALGLVDEAADAPEGLSLLCEDLFVARVHDSLTPRSCRTRPPRVRPRPGTRSRPSPRRWWAGAARARARCAPPRRWKCRLRMPARV